MRLFRCVVGLLAQSLYFVLQFFSVAFVSLTCHARPEVRLEAYRISYFCEGRWSWWLLLQSVQLGAFISLRCWFVGAITVFCFAVLERGFNISDMS